MKIITITLSIILLSAMIVLELEQHVGSQEPTGGNTLASYKDLYMEWKLQRDGGATLNDLPVDVGAEIKRDAPAVFERFADAVVIVQTPADKEGMISSGSGAIVTSDGVIVTNAHVVQSYPAVNVFFYSQNLPDVNKSRKIAKVIKLDMQRDLAVLKIQGPTAKKFNAFELGDEALMKPGTSVVLIGHPAGGALWSINTGIISGMFPKRSWMYAGDQTKHEATLIQTQAPMNPGNSGGPLLTDKGKLIGISTLSNQTGQGIHFAVAVNEVKQVLGNIAANEEPQENLCPEDYAVSDRAPESARVLGCYYSKPPVRPPDYWVAKGTATGSRAGEIYGAWGQVEKGVIDTVSATVKGQPVLFVDEDCDGTIDYGIVKQPNGKVEKISIKTGRLANWMREIELAFSAASFPYRSVRICK